MAFKRLDVRITDACMVVAKEYGQPTVLRLFRMLWYANPKSP